MTARLAMPLLVGFLIFSGRIDAQDDLVLPNLVTRPLPKVKPGDDELRQLLVKRHEAIVDEIESCFKSFGLGRRGIDIFADVLPRWAASANEVYDQPADRLPVLKNYMEFAKAIERFMEAKYTAGTVMPQEWHRVRAQSLDAQIQYLRLKRQIDKMN